MSETRNYIAESLSKTFPLPCKYRKYGCYFTGSLDEKDAHESNNCDFQPFLCPMGGCEVCVVQNQMENHFLSQHGISSLTGKKHESRDMFLFNFHLTDENTVLHLLQVPDWGLFIVRVSSENNIEEDLKVLTCIVALQAITKAKRFYYRIKFYYDEFNAFSYLGPIASLHRCNPCEDYQGIFHPNWFELSPCSCSVKIWRIND